MVQNLWSILGMISIKSSLFLRVAGYQGFDPQPYIQLVWIDWGIQRLSAAGSNLWGQKLWGVWPASHRSMTCWARSRSWWHHEITKRTRTDMDWPYLCQPKIRLYIYIYSAHLLCQMGFKQAFELAFQTGCSKRNAKLLALPIQIPSHGFSGTSRASMSATLTFTVSASLSRGTQARQLNMAPPDGKCGSTPPNMANL